MIGRNVLFVGAAVAALAAPALADDAAIEKRLDAMQRMIAAQERQIEAQKSEIESLHRALVGRAEKTAQPAATTATTSPPPPAAAEARTAGRRLQIDELANRLDATQNDIRLAKQQVPKWSLDGGRPSVTSADGRFSMAIRAIAQYDTAYYMQGAAARQLAPANGPDLSSGSNFRRVQFGLQGKLFGDWSYFFNYDFAGAGGTENPGHIQAVYIQYDGLAPLAIRIGAFPPSAGLEDNTSSPDTIFLERNSPSDIARNIAGGDGRDGIGVIYAGSRVYGALTYTGDKIQDNGVFDEQQALIGRLSGLLLSDEDANVVLSGNGTYVMKVADSAPGSGAARNITLSDPPELTVDNTGAKLISTGTLNAEHVWEWGLESGAQWRNFYAQAGYFRYGVDLRNAPGAYGFDGWYGQATWILTGEARHYSASNGAFGNPRPHEPFSLTGGGWGAWELAGRYSDMNLNDSAGAAGTPLPSGGLRGGDQRIWTLGLNWYPASALKFELQYQDSAVDRLGTIPAGSGHGALSNAQIGQSFDTVALRSQIAF